MVWRKPSQCRLRSRSGMMRSSDWPMASALTWPNMRSAPGFQKRMMPSRSAATTASDRAASTALAIRSGRSTQQSLKLASKPSQYPAFVQGDMVGLVALDLVLRLVPAGMVDVALVAHVLGVHPDDAAADPPGLGIPADVIAALEGLGHVVTGEFRQDFVPFFTYIIWDSRPGFQTGDDGETRCAVTFVRSSTSSRPRRTTRSAPPRCNSSAS